MRSIAWRDILFNHDFNYTILTHVRHRPWPMPASPWTMTQTWHDLLFAHWRIDADRLAETIPPPLRLDTFSGEAWLGIVPFHMSNVAPRGVPALPWLSAFPELNVRTYVTFGAQPGVYFFSLDATNPAAVAVARLLFGLPYFVAAIEVRRSGVVEYRSRRRGRPAAAFAATYGPVGRVFEPRSGTLEHFLTERYSLYTVDKERRPWRLEIHHPPWPLQPARADIRVNTMCAPIGIELPDHEPLLHFAARQDMVAWSLRKA
jgi:uncharacterized protein YqjF (DUF2071 family)